MKIRKAYKFRLKPSVEQQQQMLSFAGACRFLWNKILRLNLERLQNKQGLIWYREADFWSKIWKSSEEYGFLKEVPAHCLQQKLKDLSKAFQDAFDPHQPLKRIPKLKKRGIHDSLRFPEPKHIQLDNRRIKLPKLGWIRFFKSQKIVGELKNATVSSGGGYWYVSVQVEQDIPSPLHNASSAMGIDVGIAKFAALSDGSYIEAVHAFRKWEKRLVSTQRKLSRKQKWSKNWKKQKGGIQKLHSKIAYIRRDFLHKHSTQLSKSHAMIVVENLKIRNMSRSAKGTKDKPGRNVKAKSGLNKSILDQGWGEFKRQLEYKLNWLGGVFVKVDPKHTSQRCHVCQHREKSNRQSQAEFECKSCGHRENADINAARNILAAGHAVLAACGEIGLPNSMKQELLGTGNLVPA